MTSHKASASAIRAAIEALHQVRLDRDLTYDELAEEMGLSRRNLFRVMNDRGASMHDRTLHKIRLYLDRVGGSREQAAAS